jgi:hypothetical protein
MLPDYEKYMRELRRVRCRRRAQTLKTEKNGIKPLQLDLQDLPLGQALRGQ